MQSIIVDEFKTDLNIKTELLFIVEMIEVSGVI